MEQLILPISLHFEPDEETQASEVSYMGHTSQQGQESQPQPHLMVFHSSSLDKSQVRYRCLPPPALFSFCLDWSWAGRDYLGDTWGLWSDHHGQPHFPVLYSPCLLNHL